MKQTRRQCHSLFTTMKNSQERGRSLFVSSACSECMILHCDRPALFSTQHQCWRGSHRIAQLHQKRPIKRAGVAGIALRAMQTLLIKPCINEQLVENKMFDIFSNYSFGNKTINNGFANFLADGILNMANAVQSQIANLCWPAFYPKNVPPKDAVDTFGFFFRLVKNSPPQTSCFLSTHEEQPSRHASRRLSEEDRINVYGASFYDNRNEASCLIAKFPEALGDRIVAEGAFSSFMGKMKKTRGPSHYTVWLKVGCNIHQHFNCVEE